MDYCTHYERLIFTRRKLGRVRDNLSYFEAHHIIPKCMGGGDEEGNLILLTAREHFIAHRLLNKMFPDQVGLLLAVLFLCGNLSKANGTCINGRVYEGLKRKVSLQRVKNASHEDTLPLMWNFKIRAPLNAAVLRGKRPYPRKEVASAINLLIWNLLAVTAMGYNLSFPRNSSSKAVKKAGSGVKVSIRSLLKAEKILVEWGYIQSIVVDSTSPLSERKRSKIVASEKLLNDFSKYSQICVDEYSLQQES